MANRKSYTGFPMSHQPRFCAAPNFFRMGIKYLNLSSFIQVLTMKDEKSAAKFHYIKTATGNIVAQSIAFRVVSTYWQGNDHFPLKCWLKLTHPLLKAVSFDTFCLVAPQPQEILKEVQLLNKNWTWAFQRAINQGSSPPLTSSKWG